MCDHPQEPWFFHRDELSILEDGFDDLFQLHEQSSRGAVKIMEQNVLGEHLSIEEEVERAIAQRLGADILLQEEEESSAPAMPSFGENAPPSFFALHDPAMDPLYRLAITWSRRVLGWAHKEYFQAQNRNRDVYRVLVNAHLVPIKIACVQPEESEEDEVVREISHSELGLAETYVKRTVSSFKVLRLAGILTQEQDVFVEQAQQIEREILRRLEYLRRGKTRGL